MRTHGYRTLQNRTFESNDSAVQSVRLTESPEVRYSRSLSHILPTPVSTIHLINWPDHLEMYLLSLQLAIQINTQYVLRSDYTFIDYVDYSVTPGVWNSKTKHILHSYILSCVSLILKIYSLPRTLNHLIEGPCVLYVLFVSILPPPHNPKDTGTAEHQNHETNHQTSNQITGASLPVIFNWNSADEWAGWVCADLHQQTYCHKNKSNRFWDTWIQNTQLRITKPEHCLGDLTIGKDTGKNNFTDRHQ